MRRGAIARILPLCAAAACLTVFGAEESPEAKLPPQLRQLFFAAQAAPPEFAADALLRIVESGKVENRDASRELLARAFQFASSASLKFAKRARPGSLADTEAGALAVAYRLNLDSLSLQSRAARDMIPLDRAKARQLFLEIPKPALGDPVSCDDPLVPDVSALYDALAAVAQNTFTEEERKKADHVGLLLNYLSSVTTMEQVQSFGRAIGDVSVTPEQREMLSSRIESLHAAVQAKSPDCGAPSTAKKGTTMAVPDPGKTHPFWQSNSAKSILEAAKRLRFGSGGLRSDAERQSSEWLQQLTDFRSHLADWRQDESESEAVFYNEKSLVYEVLLELTERGPERDRILNEYVSFATSSNLQQDNPVLWYSGLHFTLDRMRMTTGGEPDKILDAFQASGNPILTLRAAEQRAFPTKSTFPPSFASR